MAQFSVRLRKKALADVGRIRRWYRNIDETLEERFREALNDALDSIEANPFSNPLFFRSTRRALLEKFPYKVFYVVKDSQIIVLAVIHHKRNPKLARRISE